MSVPIIGFLCLAVTVCAQIDTSLAPLPDIPDEEEQDIPEAMLLYLNQPLNINQATVSDLQNFPFLSDAHISRILSQKPIRRKSDVRQILGRTIYEQFRPYFYVGTYKAFLNWKLISRFQKPLYKSAGMISGAYNGSLWDIYSRYQISIGQTINAGILIQKDVGELSYWDHLSGFVGITLWEKRLNIVLGSFTNHAGEGLVFSSPFAQQRGADASSTLRHRRTNIRPYLSANETSGFRGVCISGIIFDDLKMSTFYSSAARDAAHISGRHISSLVTTGLHRTQLEQSRKDILSEQSAGLIFDLQLSTNFRIGSTYLKTKYSPGLNLHYHDDPDIDIRNYFYRFSGTELQLGSLFFAYQGDSFSLTAESASNNGKNLAWHVCNSYAFTKWTLGFRIWYLPPNYHSPFGRTFSNHSSFPAGEKGFYFTLSRRVNKNICIDFYWNPIRDLWRSYFEPLPPASNRLFIQCAYLFPARTTFTCAFLQSRKSHYIADTNIFIVQLKNRIRLQLDHYLSAKLRTRSRISLIHIPSDLSTDKKSGMSFYHEVDADIFKQLQLKFRFSSFTADSYDARTYEVEHSLIGVSSLTSLYYSGIKWYILLRWAISANVDFSIKFRHIHYENRDNIGSGLDKVDGAQKNDISLQFQIRG